MSQIKNIAIITTALHGGGAEKAAALQSKMFYNLGFRVYVVTMMSNIVFNCKGTILDLGLKKPQKENFIQKFKRAKTLKKLLKQHQIDIVIDNRMRSNTFYAELIMNFYVYKTYRVVFVLHSYNFPNKFAQFPILIKLLYKNAFKLVTVSLEAKKDIENRFLLKNVICIHNPFDSTTEQLANETLNNVPEEYILYFGRLFNEQKNLKFLLKAYQFSKRNEHNIKLILLGDGEDKLMLQSEVKQMGLDNDVVFLPFTKNPYPYIKKALFTVLTSNYEGFPLSIIESLACETPVVSVNCISGPSEIIKNNYNGFLVEQNNLNAFSEALNLMIKDKKLYAKIKSNTINSVKDYSEIEIKKKWFKLFKNSN